MEEENKENGISTIEPRDCCKKFQMALNKCQVDNEKLRTELTSCKRTISELEEKASNADNIQKLRAIEEAKHRVKLSKANDELFKQKTMFEQCKGYLHSTEEHAIQLKYSLTISEKTNILLKSDLSQTRNALMKECERVKAVKENHARITQKIRAEKVSLESKLAQYTDAYRELTIEHMTLEDMMETVQFLHQQKVDDLKKQLDIAREIPEFPTAEEEKQKRKENAGCRSASNKTDLIEFKEQPKSNVNLASAGLTEVKVQPKANVSLASAGFTEAKEQPKANVSLASAGLTEAKEQPKANVNLASAGLTEVKEQPKSNVNLASAGFTEVKEQPKSNVNLASAGLTEVKEQPKSNVNLASAGLTEPKLDSSSSVEIHLEKNQPKQSEELTHIRHRRLRRRANEKAHKLSARLQREALLGELVKMKSVNGGDGSAGEVDGNGKVKKRKRFCRRRQNKKTTK